MGLRVYLINKFITPYESLSREEKLATKKVRDILTPVASLYRECAPSQYTFELGYLMALDLVLCYGYSPREAIREVGRLWFWDTPDHDMIYPSWYLHRPSVYAMEGRFPQL
jgi:hypothetical protein